MDTETLPLTSEPVMMTADGTVLEIGPGAEDARKRRPREEGVCDVPRTPEGRPLRDVYASGTGPGDVEGDEDEIEETRSPTVDASGRVQRRPGNGGAGRSGCEAGVHATHQTQSPTIDSPTKTPPKYDASAVMKARWDAGEFGPRSGDAPPGADALGLPAPIEAGALEYDPTNGVEADCLTVAQMRVALIAAEGHVAYAAAALGIHVSSLLLRVERHEVLRKTVQQIEEAKLDYAESKLWGSVQLGHNWAISLYLKSKGRHRGFGDGRSRGGPNTPPGSQGQPAWADLVKMVAAASAAGAAHGIASGKTEGHHDVVDVES